METPSRGEASSPDPLNTRDNDEVTMSVLSSAARRITRSQRSNSMYSLDVRNRIQPSRFSSPRKQTFHLDVGSNTSPQKIRVTVETEDNTPDISNADDGLNDIPNTDQKVNRRLFTASTPVPTLPPKPAASSSRRRRRSPSPDKTFSTDAHSRKKARVSTTTTKVPLRGLSDDEDADATAVAATPKPKRGRPRRSGTPKPAKSLATEPSSPVAATPAKATTSTTKRGRKPRAATPKAEETTGQDELASIDATPAMSSPIKRTPRATRKATPKVTPKTTPKSSTRSAAKSTPKRAASSAFSESDAESITDSRPTKRRRGRPRRQAMAPDEMAVIVENELEEQLAAQPAQAQEPEVQQIPTAAVGTTSASPDPIMDSVDDVLDARPFHAPTPASVRRTRVAVSPAPTSLSSVDLISVQTPAHPNFETEAAPASTPDEESVQVVEHQGDQTVQTDQADEDTGDDFAYGAPSADDYFSDNGAQDYDVPGTFEDRDEPAEATAHEATSPAPATGSVQDDEPQTPKLPRFAESALAETDDAPEEPTQPAMSEAVPEGQDFSEDELASPTTHSDAGDTNNDRPIYSEDLHAITPHIHAALSPDAESSPMMEAPTLTVINTQISTVEASNASVVIDHEQHEAVVTSSPKTGLPPRIPTSHRDHSDMIHFSSVESPLVHEASTSHSRHEPQLAQSELTTAESDGDGDVDAVLLGSADDIDAQSEAESVVMDNATTNLRDMDTIAKGEDFSMIGMESLQASFHMSNATLPAMGETTSRIVSRTLESVRHGNQEAENHGNDGLSYLDFLYESNSSTPVSNPATVPVSASKTPRTPKTMPSAAFSSPNKEIEIVPQSLSAPKSDSPRKKAEPLREFIARKSLHEAHGSSATPRVVNASPQPSDLASPQIEQNEQSQVYDDSFSEIPDSVLEAAVPTITNTPFFSRHQVELTGQIAVEYAAGDASVHSSESRHEGLSNPMDAAAEDDEQVAQTQPETEITSSPPVHFSRIQHAVSEQASAQRPRLAHENRATPIGLSPRYPITSAQTDHLRVPSEGFRPSLSPIVRAGRALQSVTSDPPTPKENEGFLRSPFRTSVARDTQSPAAAQSRDSSSPEPIPPIDEAPIHNQILREQEAVDDISVIATEHTDSEIGDDTNDNVQDDVHDEEVVEEVTNATGETAPSQQSPPAATTSQRSPSSMPKAAWNMAMAPFTGIKNLVFTGGQGISPRLRFSAPGSASSGSPPSSTPAAGLIITPTPIARTTQAPSPQKRTASEAHLDAEASSSTGQRSRGAKRPRMETPSRAHEMQPGSGNDSSRTWRSYIFRENGIAGSITSFASKLVTRTPNGDENDEGSDHVIETDTNIEAIEVDSDSDVSEDSMDVNDVDLPEVNATMEDRPKASVLTSEANSTQYGSDVILSMINDISGEGKDVDAMADIESDDQLSRAQDDELDDTGMSENELPQMTPAILSIPVQQQPDEEMSEPESTDEVDIWAIEADRTTRIQAIEQDKPTAAPQVMSITQASASTATISPIPDPRLARIRGGTRRQSLASSPLAASKKHRHSVLLEDEDEDINETQGLSSAKNSPRPTGRYLDDFFSSPVALPRLLPPTSEQNIRFNEESRKKAMEQYLEHELRREAQEAAAQVQRAATQRPSSTKISPRPIAPTQISSHPTALAQISPRPIAPTQISPRPTALTQISPHPTAPTQISSPPTAPSQISPRLTAPTQISSRPTAPTQISPRPTAPTRISPPPRPTGRFPLDDFFSSPMALPRQLPPTSEQNIRFNEESRQRAMEQHLEHERQREAEEASARVRRAAVQRNLDASNKMASYDSRDPSLSYGFSSNPPTRDRSDTNLVSSPRDPTGTEPISDTPNLPTESAPKKPASADAVQTEEPTGQARQATPASDIIEDEDSFERLPSSSKTSEIRRQLLYSKFRAQQAQQLSADLGGHDSVAPPVTSQTERPPSPDAPETIVQEAVAPAASTAPRPAFTLGRPHLLHPGLARPRGDRVVSLDRLHTPKKPAPPPAKLSEKQMGKQPEARPGQPSQPGQAYLQRAPPNPVVMSDREWDEMLAHGKSTLAARRILFEDGDGQTPAASDRTIIDMLVNDEYANVEQEVEAEVRQVMEEESRLEAEEEALRRRREELLERARLREERAAPVGGLPGQQNEPERHREAGEVERFGAEDSSFLDESSFLTPVLKPLPDKTASPTKSCIRPTTKPKTPGRVVEFTSSTMAGSHGSGEEILGEREDLDNASLLFAEHFGLETSNRVPLQGLRDVRVTTSNALPLGADGDVRMWDLKEAAEEQAAAEEQRRRGRLYEVDQEVSDMMLADTHEISAAKPYQQLPQPDILAATVGRARFLPTQSVSHFRWQPPAAIEQLPGRDWQLHDWLLLNQVLQTYRQEGPLNFRLNYVPAKFNHQKAPRDFSQAPQPDRPSSILLNKIVHTKHVAMLVKDWHADVVDVFMRRSGYTWNEHYLMRRLFSLLIGEECRGVFH